MSGAFARSRRAPGRGSAEEAADQLRAASAAGAAVGRVLARLLGAAAVAGARAAARLAGAAAGGVVTGARAGLRRGLRGVLLRRGLAGPCVSAGAVVPVPAVSRCSLPAGPLLVSEGPSDVPPEGASSGPAEASGLPETWPDSLGSGMPGTLLRGASPGPGTTTRSASRTALPSRAPKSRVRPTATVATTRPRLSTQRRSCQSSARGPSLRQASAASFPSTDQTGAPAMISGVQAAR